MALSPADFAAYSRATGTPYPETPEERAQMVPEVRAFRAGQLKQRESGGENNLLTGIGIGLGLLGAAGVGGLALRGRLPKQDTSGKSRVTQRTNPPADQVKDVRPSTVATAPQPDNFTETLGNFISDVKAGRNPQRDGDFPGTATRGSGFRKFSRRADVIGDLTKRQKVYQETSMKPESDLPQVSRPQGEVEESMLVTDPNTGEVYRRGGEVSLKKQKAQEILDDRVNQLLSEISVGEAGEMLAGQEVAREAAQMMGTEASRQAATVKRIINEEGERILDEMRPKPTTFTKTVDPEKAARIARNQAKDKARVSDYMSDVLESVISETEFTSETIPSDILKLAERAGTGNIDAQDVNTFKNWAEGTFKNDPVVLGEINETLSSTTFSPKTSSLTETYETFGEPAAQVQNIEALDTASDQAAAPVERTVQRNEDVDVAAAQSFLNQQRDKLQAQGLSPTRIERVLASNPALVEAAELYASTGDESVLSRFSEQPASPVAIKAKSASRLKEIPTKEFYRKASFGEFVDNLEGKDVDLTNRISSLGAEQQQLIGRRKQLEENSLMIKSAMDREPAGKDDYSRMYGQMQYELQNMPEPESLNVDIGDAIAERENVRAQIKGLKEVGPQQFLADVTEGLRIGYEVDPQRKVVGGTAKIRSYLKPIEQVKAGGGRRAAEFTAGQRESDVVRQVRNPKSGYKQDNVPVLMRNYDDAGNQKTTFTDDRTVQSKKTIYGLQTPGEVISQGLRPSKIPESTIIEEGLRQSVAAPEGDVPMPPAPETLFIRTQPQRSQDPLKASEAVRRANIEGRDPQKVLRSMGFGV